VSIMLNIFTSNWVAVPVLIVAAVGVLMLYVKGRTHEAYVAGAVLALATYLIIRGNKKKDPEDLYPPD
jgi:hypothetical protein